MVKDGRYDYIETGSLISIKENTQNILLPSEERSICMFPMDFEAFAWAMGEDSLINYKKLFLIKMNHYINHFTRKQFNRCDYEKRVKISSINPNDKAINYEETFF